MRSLDRTAGVASDVTAPGGRARLPVRALTRTGELAVRHPAVVVGLVALAGCIVLTFPLVLHPTSSIYGPPGDATGTIGIYWWWGYALTHGRNLFDPPYGAPLGSGFDLVPFTPVQVLVSAPLSVVLGPTLTFNLEMLSGYPLSAAVTFLLARRLGLPALAAAFSALAFTFVPYHLEKSMAHLGMVHLELFSGTLLFLVRWRDTGRRRDLIGAGVVTGLALGVDPYDGYIVTVMVVAFFVVSALVPSGERTGAGRRMASHLAAGMTVGLVVALFVPAVVLTAHRPGSSGGYAQGLAASSAAASRDLANVIVYTARLQEYVLPWHANPLLPAAVRAYELAHLHGSNYFESTLFLGYTVLALAILGVLASRRAFPIAVGLAIGAAGVLFAQTPTPHHVLAGLTLEAPSGYLYSLLPWFRAYVRFAILVMLGAALLGGLGFAVLMAWFGAGRKKVLLAVPFLLVAVEFNNLPPTHTTQLYPPPAAYTWLHQQPGGVLVEYPLAYGNPQTQEIETRQYALYQQFHGHPIFNGAALTSRATMVAPTLEPYYDPGVLGRLRTLGIRYVFVHRADYRAAGLRTPEAVAGLRFVADMDGIDVFEVV